MKGKWGLKIATHFCLGPQLRMSGAIPAFPQMPSWQAQQ
jgi:hypothetical protein